MQRDKRGRFIKKAQEGTTLTLNGKKYKVNLDEARKAHETYLNTLQGKFTEEDEVFEKWLPLHGTQYLTEIQESPASINKTKIGFNSELYGFTPTIKPLEMPKLELPWEKEKEVNPVIQNLGLQNGVGSKIKYDYVEFAIEDCLIIPTSALYEFNGETFVYMLDSNTNLKKEVPIEIGYRTSSQAQVIDGLEVGDVIIEG